jgi:hypothetical protein
VADVLIVYSIIQSPPVATLYDGLYAYERHSDARCWYLNLGVRRVPRWLGRIHFDAVVFHTSLLWDRVNPRLFERHQRRLRRLEGSGSRRVALPQDEYLRSRALTEFITEFDVDHVFSVAPESEWGKLYEGLDRTRVGVSRVLTGYLAPDTLERIEEIVAAGGERPIAIGYRSAKNSPALGRHGALKEEIGVRVQAAAERRGLDVDIATGGASTLRGDDWYRFLAACRYTIGVEGGSSVHDPDGTLGACAHSYSRDHPEASFEEVEASCFPGRDGALRYFAISPRHLEACATRTAQILVEGSYNGVLKPGEHYVELKCDFSNLEDVLALVERDSERARIVENAYRDVVASGAYTYKRLVEEVESVALAGARETSLSSGMRILYRWMRMTDRLSWRKAALYVRVAGRLRAFAYSLPEPVVNLIRRCMSGTAAETAAAQSAN